eukprot:1776181-Rhodomonas_salina.2
MSGTDIVHVVNRLKSHLVVAKFIDPRHAHRGHVLIDFKRAGWDGWRLVSTDTACPSAFRITGGGQSAVRHHVQTRNVEDETGGGRQEGLGASGGGDEGWEEHCEPWPAG